MTTQFCRSLISRSLNKSSRLHRPPIFYSISILFFSSSQPKKSESAIPLSEYLINQHQFLPEVALKASSAVSLIKNPESSDSVISYLKESGFTNSHVEKVMERLPRVLSANLDSTIKPKIKIFQDLGFSSADIADIISSDPWILGRSADNQLGPSISVLKSVLGSNSAVSKVLKIYGCFLKYNLEKTMLPSIEYLKSCGVSSSQIVKYVFYFPRFFLYKPEAIKDFVRRVDEMGLDRKSSKFLPAIVAVSSMSVESWEFKLKLFRSLGFTEDDILSAFRRVPQVFSTSERKIKEVTETLLSRGNLDISFIVNHVELLMCSLERRIKPRLEVFDILESKNLLTRKPSLTTICKISNERFLRKYVLPYSDELGEVSMARKAHSQ